MVEFYLGMESGWLVSHFARQHPSSTIFHLLIKGLQSCNELLLFGHVKFLSERQKKIGRHWAGECVIQLDQCNCSVKILPFPSGTLNFTPNLL